MLHDLVGLLGALWVIKDLFKVDVLHLGSQLVSPSMGHLKQAFLDYVHFVRGLTLLENDLVFEALQYHEVVGEPHQVCSREILEDRDMLYEVDFVLDLVNFCVLEAFFVVLFGQNHEMTFIQGLKRSHPGLP